MPKPYDKMTTEDFDRLLIEVMEQESVSALLQVPGVYEIVSEHYNNDVLDAWTAEQEETNDHE